MFAARNMMFSHSSYDWDADAVLYIAAVESALSSTITTSQKSAINDFVVAERLAGRWTSLKRLYLPIWGVASANARCLVSGTSGTWVGGVTHAAGYAQGNGTTGYFSYDASMPSLGITENSCASGLLIYELPPPDKIGYYMHAQNGIVPFGLRSSSTDLLGSTYANNAVAWNANFTNHSGIIIATRTASNANALCQRKATGFYTRVTSTTAPSGPQGSERMYVFARNFQGSAIDYSSFKCGSSFVSTGLNSEQCGALTLNLKTMWETCTGLALP